MLARFDSVDAVNMDDFNADGGGDVKDRVFDGHRCKIPQTMLAGGELK